MGKNYIKIMAEEFDIQVARGRHNQLILEVERIRNDLTTNVINYYYSYPTTEMEEMEKRNGMRRYLKDTYQAIGNLLDRLN